MPRRAAAEAAAREKKTRARHRRVGAAAVRGVRGRAGGAGACAWQTDPNYGAYGGTKSITSPIELRTTQPHHQWRARALAKPKPVELVAPPTSNDADPYSIKQCAATRARILGVKLTASIKTTAISKQTDGDAR